MQALRQMVLIGRSMGGLVSKLQVTSSGQAIWSRVANRPLESIVADEGTKARLRRDVFFEPSPFVRRVVFVGTPHSGSPLASNCIGRIASWDIEPSPEWARIHQMLIQSNPNTFSPEVTDGFPNSVDLLEPTSPLLAALRQMQVNPQVRMHSIIGRGYPMLISGDSDGVVPISSARHPGVQTEPPHAGLAHRDPQSARDTSGVAVDPERALRRAPSDPGAMPQMTLDRLSVAWHYPATE